MSDLLMSREGATAILTISNPGKRNAVTPDMWRAFPAALEDLQLDHDVRVIVITGDGDDFSAGADISAVSDPAAKELSSDAELALERCAKPVLAAIRGYCLGGGCEIALAGDVRLAAPDAKFGIPPANLGLVYPLPGLRSLVRAVGPAQAKRLLFTGRRIDAAEALRIGLVDQLVDGDVLAATMELAEQIASRSQLTVHASKAMIRALADDEEDAELVARHWRELGLNADDLREGQAAFAEKREPHFTWNG